MSSDVETFIAQNCPWEKLPIEIKQLLGNSQKEYEKHVTEYSVKTQQRYRGNLVRQILKNERNYYEDVLSYSRSHLMMYPYHLSDVVVKGLRVTPFQYYISILTDIMTAEKSYDSLPNFTAADCLRLLGIGRNQYIDLMNQCRSSRKLFRKKNVRDLLPAVPCEITVDPWWTVCVGCVTEEDIKNLVSAKEKDVIDMLIDNGPQKAGDLEKYCVHTLYAKGLIYLEVPISDSDCISVPPLEGFVMNRVLGDYLENLMYKIFVSIDEYTPISELAVVLEIDLSLVKVAVSLFCRLGFANKKNVEMSSLELHPSWEDPSSPSTKKLPMTADDLLLLELESALAESVITDSVDEGLLSSPRTPMEDPLTSLVSIAGQGKRIAFLFDSTLTAFLMMGNLSPGLKSHAVTMFEVGKMLDEGLDSLLVELDKIQRSDSEGEAQRYFEHALTLRTSITFLRHNRNLSPPNTEVPPGLDLIRWESLSNLDPATTARLLKKNYRFLVSMAPLSYEIPAIEGDTPPHFGPAIPEMNSVWFKLFLYHITGSGPPSLLLPKGYRLRCLAPALLGYEKVLVTPWGHDPTVVPLSALFMTVNEALMHSPVFIQAYGWYHDVCTRHIPFPLDSNDKDPLIHHPAIKKLEKQLDLTHNFGYIKLVSFPTVDVAIARDGLHLGSAEISTGVPQGLPQGLPQVMSFDDINNISVLEGEKEEPLPKAEVTRKISESEMPKVCAREGLSLPLTNMSEGEWLILECNFGLPLFDASLNQLVSQKIIQHDLFSSASVESFLESNASLVDRLKEFIDNNKAQAVPLDHQQKGQSKEGMSSLPLPTCPLLFNDGILTCWGGT
ncbi:protein FAM91A1 isoform X2 [Oratosquilla oratoria]|uniref:protein FAM91A1 isoform X2 n=1 Tax=Oratosquilla oratoria TaxID=337810 RepID=UPI003F761B94